MYAALYIAQLLLWDITLIFGRTLHCQPTTATTTDYISIDMMLVEWCYKEEGKEE